MFESRFKKNFFCVLQEPWDLCAHVIPFLSTLKLLKKTEEVHLQAC